MACIQDHTGNLPRPRVEDVENWRRDFWRHKCAECAYEMGPADSGFSEANVRRRAQELQARVDTREAQIKNCGLE